MIFWAEKNPLNSDEKMLDLGGWRLPWSPEDFSKMSLVTVEADRFRLNFQASLPV